MTTESTTTTHTPGPWKVEGDDWVTGPGENPREPGCVRLVCVGGDIAEWPANARLIAAAPALLDALKDARALIEDAAIEWPNAMGLTETDATIGGIERSEWMITLDRVLAAIAQATGEAQ